MHVMNLIIAQHFLGVSQHPHAYMESNIGWKEPLNKQKTYIPIRERIPIGI